MLLSKHHQGATLTAHTYNARRREIGLMAVTRNILILRLIKLFYRIILTPFLPFSGSLAVRHVQG